MSNNKDKFTNISHKKNNSSFYKTVAALVIPMAIQNLINVGITSTDVIMLGSVNETVLSGASLGSQVNFIMNLILFGLSSGASVLIAQYWGKKDLDSIKTVFGISMKISILIGVLFTAVTLIFPNQIMLIFSNEEAVIKEGTTYLRIVCLSYLISSITMIYLNTVRCMERVVIATWTYLASLITNVIVNAILIFGLFGFPKMGVAGAAIGTVVARTVELIIVIIYDLKFNDVIKFKFSYMLRKNALLARDFRKYSLPVVANELMWGTGMAAIAAIIGHLGQSAVAANSVAQVARQLATVICFGVSSATAIMLGKSIGEGNIEEARENGSRFFKLSLITGALGSVVMLIARPILLHFMSLSPTAYEYLSLMMFVLSYYIIFQSLNTTLIVGVFRSGGDTLFGLFVDVSFMWGVSILCGFIAAFIFKLPVMVVYLILLSDEIIKAPITCIRYKSYKWLKNVTR